MSIDKDRLFFDEYHAVNIGKKTFLKKIIRKLISWYIKPIVDKMNETNREFLELNNILKENMITQSKRLDSQEEEIDAISKHLDSQTEQIVATSTTLNNKEYVRWGYRLFLDREPESENALNKSFSNTQELRQMFTTSNEYINVIYGQSIDIVDININNTKFFWVLNTHQKDPISESARKGFIAIEHELFSLFNKTGTFLDIGANIGAFTLSFASKGWNGYAFEASKINNTVLEKSILLNDFNVTCIKKAVFEKSGSLYFVQSGPYGHIQTDILPSENGEQMECVCIDDWLEQENITQVIDFIKLDIEGAEISALKGMKKTLEKNNFPPIFVESNSYTLFFYNETQKSLLDFAKSLGYEIYKLEGNNLLKYDINNFPDIMCTDFILLKNINDNIMAKIYGDVVQDEDSITQYIIATLTDVYNAKEFNKNVVYCFALKDYPQYYSKPEINNLLKRITEKNQHDPLFKKYLGWF
jgi:FkbM family methyltransferase